MSAAAFLAAGGAAAQSTSGDDTPESRWYGAIDLGFHAPENIASHSVGLAPDGSPYNWNWRFTSDWAAFARLGYRVSRHVRVELEGGYSPSRPDSVLAPGGVVDGLSVARPGEPYGLCAPGSTPTACGRPIGISNSFSLMSNVIFDILPDRRLDPFVGAGVGADHIQFQGNNLFGNVTGAISPNNPAVQSLNIGGTVDHPSQFAFQALGGVSYRIARGFHIDLTYRFLSADLLRWNTANTTPGIVGSANGLQPLDFRGALHIHTLTVGLRHAF